MASYQVLIVEDDPVSAKVYSSTLMDYGTFITEEVPCIKEAFARLAIVAPPTIDIVLLDLILPNGEGIDVIRSFNARYPHVPLVVVTGMVIEVEKAIEAGAESVLIKGEFNHETMIRCMSEAIPRHRVRWQFKPLEEEAKYLAKEMKIVDQQLARLEESLTPKLIEPVADSSTS